MSIALIYDRILKRYREDSTGGAPAGEANTTSNEGSGEGLAMAKAGVNLPFKSLVSGIGNIVLSAAADEVSIDIDPVLLDRQNGFPDRTETTLAMNDTTREFSCAPDATDFTYYAAGVKYTLATTETVTIPDVTGLYLVYFSGGTGTLTATLITGQISDSLFFDNAWVAAVYWNATDGETVTLTDERHGSDMAATTHLYNHNKSGTVYPIQNSGLALTDITADGSGNNDSSATAGVQSGFIMDEDIFHNISTMASPAQIPVLHRVGAAGVWSKIAATNAPISTTGSGRAAWNEFTGGSWQLTEVGNNDFVLMHLYATGDLVDSSIVAVMGQNTYPTVSQARTGAAVELTQLQLSGIPSIEFKSIGTLIYQTSSSYSNTWQSRIRSADDGDDYIDWRFTAVVPGGTVTDSTNPVFETVIVGPGGSLSHVINGTAVSSLVEAHSEGDDDLGAQVIHRHTDTLDYGAHNVYLTSRGTHASPTAVIDTQVLARMVAAGYDGTDYALAAEIRAIVDGTPGANDMPTAWEFLTTPDGTQVPVLRMKLGPDGTLNLFDNVLQRPILKDYGESVNAIGATGGGTQDIDLELGNTVTATVDTSANTFTFSNPTASPNACSFTLILTNGGSQTVNWPASVDWAGGTEPTLTASGVDILTFLTVDGGTTWHGFTASLDSKQ